MRPAWPGADPGEADPVQEAQHQRDLDRTLASEVVGEIVFAAAARWTRAPERREKWPRLRKLETQTKQRLVDFLEAQGERAEPPRWPRLTGWAVGTALAFLPRGALDAASRARHPWPSRDLRAPGAEGLSPGRWIPQLRRRPRASECGVRPARARRSIRDVAVPGSRWQRLLPGSAPRGVRRARGGSGGGPIKAPPPPADRGRVECFYHEGRAAVGSCRSCFRGLCRVCGVDLDRALACRGRCEEPVRALLSSLEQSVRYQGLSSGLVQTASHLWIGGLCVLLGRNVRRAREAASNPTG